MSQQINLFNPAYEPRKQHFGAGMLAALLAVLLLGLWATGIKGSVDGQALQQRIDANAKLLAQRKAQLAAVNKEFVPRERDPQLEQQVALATRQLEALREIAEAVSRDELGDTRGLSGYYKALANQSMPGLWLTGVDVSANGRQLAISGRTTDAALVPRYLERLRHEPLMQGKSFGSLHIGQAQAAAGDTQAAPFIEFSLQAQGSAQ